MAGAAGGYYVTVTTTAAGTYPLSIFAGGEAASSVAATRSVVVAPGKPVLADCVLSGDGVGSVVVAAGGASESAAVAGQLSEMKLRGRDRFNNPAPISAEDVEGVSFVVDVTVVVPVHGGGTNRVTGAATAALTPFAPVGLEAPGLAASAYVLRWTPKVAGKLLTAVSLYEMATGKSTPLREGTREGTVLAAEVDPSSSSATDDAMWGSESGAAGRMFIVPRDRFGNVDVTAQSCAKHRAAFVNASLPDNGGAANLTAVAPFAGVDAAAGVCIADFVVSFSPAATYPLVLVQLQVIHVANQSGGGGVVVVLQRQVTVLPATTSSTARAVDVARTFTYGGGMESDAHLKAGLQGLQGWHATPRAPGGGQVGVPWTHTGCHRLVF
jgi:hypothetical protein